MSGCVFLSETESRHQLAGLFQRICGEMAKVLLTLWTQLYYLMLGKCRAGYECRARWPTAGHCLWLTVSGWPAFPNEVYKTTCVGLHLRSRSRRCGTAFCVVSWKPMVISLGLAERSWEGMPLCKLPDVIDLTWLETQASLDNGSAAWANPEWGGQSRSRRCYRQRRRFRWRYINWTVESSLSVAVLIGAFESEDDVTVRCVENILPSLVDKGSPEKGTEN